MTEQEIQAVLMAQAHIDSRKRAMISMALGKMKEVLKKSGVVIHQSVWEEFCCQGREMLLQQGFDGDQSGRVATIAEVLDKNPQYLRGRFQAASGQHQAQSSLRLFDKAGNKARRRRGFLRFRPLLQRKGGQGRIEPVEVGSR